ncbi:alkylglycerol monooxygenase-like [Dermacentor silvarum]|uniref:alkylglycerol monooxygenase-like n=1 Tax=Dermacentor silvarum TaxID=543639 RepID=UPI0018982417|nr:alkylglycerol monooxygenase-like [Dermacentor silvarum]
MELREIVKRAGYLLYIVSPNETSFERLEDVPDYVVQAVPLFVAFLVIELIFNFVQRKSDRFQLDDGLTSIGQGIIQELSRLFTESTLLAGYIYVYEHHRIVTLPWNSTKTWFFALLAVDFAYYWMHRWAHEVNLAWSGHQVHHSSQFYNLTTALRQSALQAYYEPVLYLPLAVVLSPSAYLVHHQFNRLYQFLIHTESVQSLGPLEYVLNTPSHHRVHHGRDRYCIDKNYGGTLIIWDRLFGTFAAEQRRPAYGLTHSVNTFDPWTLQMQHFLYICKQVITIKGLGNKFSTVFKGPGWQPGKPRLGDPNDIPDVRRPVEPYAPETTLLRKLYVALHFTLIGIGYVKLKHWSPVTGTGALLCGIAYIFFSLGVMGAFLDNRTHIYGLEALRCALMLMLDVRVFHLSVMADSAAGMVFLNIVRATYAASLLGCLAASVWGTLKRVLKKKLA